jgi:hypothetical protein
MELHLELPSENEYKYGLFHTQKKENLEKVSWVQIAVITEPFTAKNVKCGIQIATIVMIQNFEVVSDDLRNLYSWKLWSKANYEVL